MSGQAQQAGAAIGDVVIDGLEFARQGRHLTGRSPVAGFPRLADQLIDAAGDIEWQLSGERDREGKSFLVLQLRGRLGLRCQRCLGRVEERLAVVSRLLLVAEGQDWPDDELAEDGFDAVAAGREMALLPMVEDEVLLALPIAPMHEDCELPAPAREQHEPSPFAALAKLKKGV